jgi:hypothetical protein
LLEELATQCDATAHEAHLHHALTQLAQACMGDEPAQRPRLAQMCDALKALHA